MSRPTKAICIAAGRGRRLEDNTAEIPKCLVPVGDRPMLRWQVDAFRAHGIRELVIIRGYLGQVLEARRADFGDVEVRFVDNPDWERNNILLSLLHAEHELDGPVLLTYSDIIFTPEVVGRLMTSAGDIALVIDREFARIYQGRTQHPLEEAEVSDLDPAGNVRRVGKRALPADQAFGEFIGLARLSAAGADLVRRTGAELRARYRGREEQPFQRAAAFRNAYLTDLWQHLIDAGHPLTPVPIDGQWREIDTVQDLQRARELLRSTQEEWR